MSTARSFGMNAATKRMSPTQTPTERAATPVSSTIEIPVAYVVFGSVPARPDNRLPRPSAEIAPWIDRKSMARGRRHDTRWMATPSPSVSIAPTRVTSTNAGSKAQNSGPKPRSRPG